MEAYRSLMYRDVYVKTSRDANEWLLDTRIHCETADSGTEHRGTWIVLLTDLTGTTVINRLISTDVIVTGNQQREAFVDFQLKVNDQQVNSY